MLKSKAKWTFKEENEVNLNELDELNISNTLKKLLAQRNINTKDEADRFLKPQLHDLQSPADLDGIDRAVERIDHAIENGQMIIIYGDYDADGVCSTTVLLKTLTELGAQCDFYIPNRFTEGYGLNNEAIKQLYNDGCDLLITVDNGIASFEEVDLANELGMDVIITDHHEIQGDVPNAFAIIHPDNSPLYRFKQLAGVSVAFKLAEQLLGFFPEQFLDLVAIGTIADLVPLIDENRILVHHGLTVLNETDNIGLKALIKTCRIEKPIDEENVGFMIAPRINAVGRLQSASLAVQLLMSEYEEEAETIADEIEKINRERQQIVAKIVREAEKMVNPNDGIIVLEKEDWHEGVLGICASRLVNTYDRPVIMLNYNSEKDEYKGSARSIPAFDLFESCMSIRHLFKSFGGHSQAAGMTIASNHLNEVKEELNNIILNELTEEQFRQEITICQTVPITEVNEGLVNEFRKLAPFGMSNPKPIIHLEQTPTDIRQIGQQKNHLKMQFEHDHSKVDVIGFNKGNLYHYISKNTPVSAVGSLGINEWNGNTTVQLVVEDMMINEFQLFDYRGRENWLDLTTYTSYYDRFLIVSEKQDNQNENYITFNTDNFQLEEVDLLVISTLPSTLKELERITKLTNPNSVLVNFEVNDQAFLQSIPSREDFKWLYSYLFKYERVDMKTEIKKIMQMKRWTKDNIIFMVQVFLDLQFVTAQSGIVEINKQAQRSDLTASPTYEKKMKQNEIEKLLYLSSATELKNIFLQWLNKEEVPKEDAIYGL